MKPPTPQYSPAPENFRGLNAAGEIVNPCSTTKIPKHYQSVVTDAVCAAQQEFSGRLHSIYIYGSVGQGTAIPFRSDLDLSVIMFVQPAAEHEERFTAIANEICARHRLISKLDFDVGGLRSVMAPEQKFGWHYWLAQCSANLRGEDLSKNFGALTPSLELAYGLNKDLAARVKGTIDSLDDRNVIEKSRAVAKKLVRSAYSLIAEVDRSWYTDIALCADIFTRYYPEFAAGIQQSLDIAARGTDVESLEVYLATFGQAIIDLFTEKTQIIADNQMLRATPYSRMESR